MSDETIKPQEDGFEYQGRFYTWHVSDLGKDLMLIDRFAGMSVTDFFDIVDDEHERARGPILLTLIATSIRHGHPSWSVERIVRTVMDLSLSDVEFLSAEDEEEAVRPPPLEEAPPPSDERSTSPLNGSSSSSAPTDDSTSETLYGTPV